MRKISIAGVCLALAFSAAACGSDDNSDSSGSSSSSGSTGAAGTAGAYGGNSDTDATAESSAGAGAGDTVTIKMESIQFSPKSMTAKVGQTVKWENEDTVDHNVTADKGEDFKSKDFGQGGTYAYKLDEAGTIEYECTLHPGMVGTIKVTE